MSIDEWIEREFAGYGVAIRRKEDTPLLTEPLMSMADAKELTRRAVAAFGVAVATDVDSLRDTIARAIYRYQEGPGTFDQPGTMMGDLVKQISVDEAENIRRAIMGEPPLPQDAPQADDDVRF